MKTESEIIASSLEERQKLWVELKQTPTNDKDYASAKAILTVIEATDDWEEPKKLDAVATDNTIVDGKPIKKGETVKVYEWQFNALRRHLATPEESEKRAAKRSPKAGAAAAVIAFLLFAFGFTATAQVQNYLIGAPGTYNVVSIAGLNGGTNNVLGTNSAYATATITTNTAVVPNWTFSNGIWTNTPSTNVISIVTNTPGVVSLVNMDMCDIAFSAQLNAAGTSNAQATFDTSDDLVNWQTNHYQAIITMAGTSQVTTNLPLTLIPFGYIRLNTISYPSPTVALTNLYITLAKKPGRTGP